VAGSAGLLPIGFGRFEREAETKTVDRIDHLFHADPISVKRHPRLLPLEAHLGKNLKFLKAVLP
jgi:hypothetical protein